MTTSTTKHTSGPWETETGRSVWEISRGWTICTLNHDTFGDEGMLANAQLIAAAPELLEAAQEVETASQGLKLDAPMQEAIDKLWAAIAKAEGKVTE